MNGPEHYAAAEMMVTAATQMPNVDPSDEEFAVRRDTLLAAQTHATLAMVAAQIDPWLMTALGNQGRPMSNPPPDDWFRVLGRWPADVVDDGTVTEPPKS